MATATDARTDARDVRYMTAALALARRGLGRVWPNPAVGCVIVSPDGEVVGRGWTQPGGRPHAETEALARAGDRAKGATAYVSLEPCAHTGKTGPCADALVKAGVARVVAAIEDPDPRVSGEGMARIKKAGIATRTGVCRTDAERLNAGFLKRVTASHPFVTLKLATTLDGRIATHTGASQWITGPVARSWGHALRASHDAVITGVATVRADDPELTCRLSGMNAYSPVRVIMDSRLDMPFTSRIAATASETATWIITCADADDTRRDAIGDLGIELIEVPADDGGRPQVEPTLRELASRGVTRVLVEGGAQITATFLRARAVDRICWFRAPDIIGGDGLPMASAFGVDTLKQMVSFNRVRTIPAGRDVLEVYDYGARDV